MSILAAAGMGLPVELVVVLSTTVHTLLLCTALHELYSVSSANAFALQLIHTVPYDQPTECNSRQKAACSFLQLWIACWQVLRQ